MKHVRRIRRGGFSSGWFRWTIRHPIKSTKFTLYVLGAVLQPAKQRLLRLWQAF